MAKTLFEFFQGQGKALPSVQERSKTFESAGLGSASEFRGTAAQNTRLLNFLQNQNNNITKENPPDQLSVEELNNVPEPNIPEMNQADDTAGLVESGETLRNQRQTELDRQIEQATERIEPIQDEQNQLVSRLKEELDIDAPSRLSRLTEEEDKLGIRQSFSQLQELNTQIAQTTSAFNKGIVDIEGKPIAMRFIAGQQAQLRRQQAVEVGALSAAAEALKGNISIAQQLAQRTVDAEFAVQEQRIQRLTSLIDLNYSQLTSAEKKRADLVMQQQEQAQMRIDQQKEERKAVFEIMQDAAKNGADSSTLTRILRAESREEALLNGAEFMSVPDYQVIEVGGRKKLLNKRLGTIEKDLGVADVTTPKPQKIGTDMFGDDLFGLWNSDTGTFDPVSVPNASVLGQDDLARAINTSISTLGLTKDTRENATRNIMSLLQTGDVDAAKSALETLVTNNLRATEADKLAAWEQSTTSLKTIKDGLKELEAKGGDTGFFVGKSEEALQKLGRTANTDLARLQAKIGMAIIDYRKNVSGAAFTESEGKEYEKLFPSVGKTPELNETLIDSLLESFEENKEGFIKRKVGANAYDTIFGSTVSTPQVPQLNQSYPSVESMLADQPIYENLVIDIYEQNPNATDSEVFQAIQQITADLPPPALVFNQPVGSGLNNPKLSTLSTGQTKLSLLGEGYITGFGSPVWKPGLDFVLKGGKGAKVQVGVPLKVVRVDAGFSNPTNRPLDKNTGKSQNSGFGNRVRVQLPDGTELDFSHLDRVGNLKPGTVIPAGAPFATQGNTGLTMGQSGTHLDITGRRNGELLTAKEVAAILGDIRLT